MRVLISSNRGFINRLFLKFVIFFGFIILFNADRTHAFFYQHKHFFWLFHLRFAFRFVFIYKVVSDNAVSILRIFLIPVGSGSAGSAVVHRLAMDKHNYKVLLLEVGGNQFPLSGVPALLFELLNNPEIDWSDVIVPQKGACKAFKNDVRQNPKESRRKKCKIFHSLTGCSFPKRQRHWWITQFELDGKSTSQFYRVCLPVDNQNYLGCDARQSKWLRSMGKREWRSSMDTQEPIAIL